MEGARRETGRKLDLTPGRQLYPARAEAEAARFWVVPQFEFGFRPRRKLLHLTERYGAKFLPDDMTIQDYGVAYNDLEPHYDRFEYLCGTAGTARAI